MQKLAVICLVFHTCVIFGHGKKRHSLLQPVDWKTIEEHAAQSEVADGAQIPAAEGSIANDGTEIYSEGSHAANTWHLPQTAKTRNGLADDSTSGTTTENKWGFDPECHIVCKKLLCFGWGPPPSEMCERGEYKHRCCEKFKSKDTVLQVYGNTSGSLYNEPDFSSKFLPLSSGPFSSIVLSTPVLTETVTTPAPKTTTEIVNTVTTNLRRTGNAQAGRSITLSVLTTSKPTRPTLAPTQRKKLEKYVPTTKKPAKQLLKVSTTKPANSKLVKKSKHITTKPAKRSQLAQNTAAKKKANTPSVKEKDDKKPKTTAKPKAIKAIQTSKQPRQNTTISKRPESICSNFSKFQEKCRIYPKCDFDCNTRTCELTNRKYIKRSKEEICKTQFCFLDLCSCRGCDLAYNVGAGICEQPKKVCEKLKFGKDECQRPNKNYAYSGVICKSSSKVQNFCQVEQTILAVNLGTKGVNQKWKDGRNISHLSDEGVPFEDPFNTKRKWTWIPKQKLGVNKQDYDLKFYETTVHGNAKEGGSARCLTYKIKLWQDGKYELAVKLADAAQSAARNRMFNIFLNGVQAMAEIDIATIAGDRSSIAEIFLNFVVSKSGTILSIPGFHYSKISDGYANLSFCYGNCPKQSLYQEYAVAAFSVIKFASWKDEESKKCSAFKDNACTSRKYGCQYSIITGDAVPIQNCSKAFFSEVDCRRRNTFYLDGGVLCHNKINIGGNCQISDTILALNMHSGRYGPDSRGIYYRSQRDLPPIDPYHTVKGKVVNKVSGVDKKDKELFVSYIYGDSHANRTTTDACAYWNIPIRKDGLYEISIKTADFYYSQRGSRTFSIKINDDVILQDIDLLGLAPKGTAVDIIINFEVFHGGSVLHLRGFPYKQMRDHVKLEFCYGGCKTESRNWMLGAFYVVRFAKENLHMRGL